MYLWLKFGDNRLLKVFRCWCVANCFDLVMLWLCSKNSLSCLCLLQDVVPMLIVRIIIAFGSS